MDYTNIGSRELQNRRADMAEQSQVLSTNYFLSNIMDASGKAIDEKYLRQRPLHKSWLTLVFPQERLSLQDFRLWEEALVELIQ